VCGIVGTYDIALDAGRWAAVSDALAHRGPDAAGTWTGPDDAEWVRLGHRRLSIIDLSAAANQPFVKDGLVLVFGGEIYNYRQLRAELGGAGISFRTSSDTEVLLEVWRRWGPASLRLRGMFAFALFDERQGTLSLAGDQFGIKPLFWTARDGGVAFASELKALRPLLGERPPVDHTAIVVSLPYYWIPEDHCVYQGVHQLPSGSWLEVGPDGRRRQGRFFDPRAELAAPSGRRVDVEELRRLLEDSVAAHLVADVPISTFLSGGLDSSVVTVLAARRNRNIDCDTISFRPEDRRLEAMPDDLAYARKLAGQHGIRLHEVEIAPDVADLLPRMVHILDDPDRRRHRHQHLSHLPGRRARRGQGAAVRHGRRRAVRRLPQALRRAARRPLPPPARRPAPPGRRARGQAAADARPASLLPCGALGQAFRGLRGPARGGGVPPQLHPHRRRRAARAARLRALAAGRPAGRGARGRLRRGPGRSCIAPRDCSACRCGPGSAATWPTWSRTWSPGGPWLPPGWWTS
jgi:asparagine synthetase B (glutamine-hydrolysing)